jgi:hypothetical protein
MCTAEPTFLPLVDCPSALRIVSQILSFILCLMVTLICKWLTGAYIIMVMHCKLCNSNWFRLQQA